MQCRQRSDVLLECGWLGNRIRMELALDPVFEADLRDVIDVSRAWAESKTVEDMH
jgi:hypothetical protein